MHVYHYCGMSASLVQKLQRHLLTGFFMVSGVASIPGKSRAWQRGIQLAIICLGGCLLLPWGYPLTSGISCQTLLATFLISQHVQSVSNQYRLVSFAQTFELATLLEGW